jgi:hypothetical protein
MQEMVVAIATTERLAGWVVEIPPLIDLAERLSPASTTLG